MGCEPILNLAATSDEAVSIICTVVNKTILLTLWGKLMYVSYTTSVSFEGMGCEPILNLAATPDEAVSIICTIVNKTILLTLWGKLMYVSYTTDRPVFQ
jgi:hypothetical protein